MKKTEKPRNSNLAVTIIILAVSIILLAFVDAVMMENVYKQVSSQHDVAWKEFEITLNLFGSNIVLTQWNFALIILALFFFILLGLAARDWRLSASGIALFATGWEDITYYLIQLQNLPATLEWLDYNPFVSWTRIITQSSHVTNAGLVISAVFGLLVVFLILSWKRFFKKK